MKDLYTKLGPGGQHPAPSRTPWSKDDATAKTDAATSRMQRCSRRTARLIDTDMRLL
jgi:hypothetical protein